ncbi:lipoprotein insertase outer membrane protein LolB [Celerinatantimonas diazotrophica]|uniref:Outer-membrane lipoprotein LolB n=1 Tax=Celerinatantimonas diazotrophica TaxID=412034 RepID=A0A4R1JLT8_9GAMM|nr:lipoprotein insertase outer membrane protein LolB [Celerinatantimonas diazotrophica]TCK52006.1 outer membrane lipoprotein LolB [Celerinatantimonas diazotrophica]CAG9296291.1 Outer-membrane lipoprotein LolB [Celerinatantimonas diazotrophica]
MFRSIFVIAFLALLSGCAMHPTPPAQGSWQQVNQQLKHIQSWQMNGQIAFITPKIRRRADLFWQHRKTSDQLILTGPFGQQLLTAMITPQGATIVADGKTYRGPDSSQLIYQLTGWQLPINRLPAWLIGLPNSADYQLNAQNRLGKVTSNDGWILSYQGYMQVGNYVLPQKLNATSANTRLKLIIDNWKVTSDPHD